MLIFFLFFFSHAQGSVLEKSLELNPRVEVVQGSKTQAERAFLKARGNAKYRDFQGTFESWGEIDGAATYPDQRYSRSTFALQEAYLEYKYDWIFLRAGRQPVRWSESWALPSLDVWTARRWNRLFFDPVSEQLIHPIGFLVSAVGSTASIDFFQALYPAYPILPKPYKNADIEWFPAWGTRGKWRTQGFDLSAVYALQQDVNTYGGGVSYAFDSCVPKAEFGTNSDDENFGTIGVDIFWGQWSVLPQVTRFISPVNTHDQYQNLYYLPIRYANDPHQFDLQIYRNEMSQDSFYAITYTYNFTNGIQVTGYMQNYYGDPLTLFGYYKEMTGGTVTGLRLAYNYAL